MYIEKRSAATTAIWRKIKNYNSGGLSLACEHKQFECIFIGFYLLDISMVLTSIKLNLVSRTTEVQRT